MKVATAGTCGLAFVMASGALNGALIGAATGAVGGGLKSAMDYMEEHDTLDGSGSQILSGAAEGFAKGAASGAASGAMAGAAKYAKNLSGYCFVAGTLVLTAVGKYRCHKCDYRSTIIPKFRGNSSSYADFIAERGIDVDQYTVTVGAGKVQRCDVK